MSNIRNVMSSKLVGYKSDFQKCFERKIAEIIGTRKVLLKKLKKSKLQISEQTN